MIYYFTSKEDFDNQILYPKIPKNRMPGEDETTPRICVSKSINGCLSGVQNYEKNDIVNIYKCESDNVMQPSLEQLPDSLFSGEEWILEPVLMTLLMKIKIQDIIKTNILIYSYSYMANYIYDFEVIDIY